MVTRVTVESRKTCGKIQNRPLMLDEPSDLTQASVISVFLLTTKTFIGTVFGSLTDYDLRSRLRPLSFQF
jgi:hypothetical protein